MATTTTQSENIHMYVNDMAALEKHILEAFARQRADERVQADPACAALIEELHSAAEGRLRDIENHAASFAGPSGGAIKEAVAGIAGVVAGLYDKVRKHPLSRMLRDDSTALSLTATGYSMLYTTGLAVRDLAVANVALRHLRGITPQIMSLSHVIPAIVVKELAEDDPAVDHSAVGIAQEKIKAAWGDQK